MTSFNLSITSSFSKSNPLVAVVPACNTLMSVNNQVKNLFTYLHIYLTIPTYFERPIIGLIGLSSVLRLRQHSIGYMGDGFYRSKDPTNSIKVLKEQIVHRQIKHTISRYEHKTQQIPQSGPVYNNMGLSLIHI